MNNFESFWEFKECIIRGGEPVFEWMESDTGYVLQRMAIVSHTQMAPMNGFTIPRMSSWSIWLMAKD